MRNVWAVILIIVLLSGCKKETPVAPDEPDPNTPATLVIDVPEQFITDSLYSYSLSIEDEDGIDSILFDLDAQAENSRVFSNFDIQLSGFITQWDTTLSVKFFEPVTAEFTLSFKDRAEVPERDNLSRSILVELAPNQTTVFNNRFPPGRAGDALSWQWKAQDKQRILEAVAGYVYKGGTDTIFVDISVNGETAETTKELTFTEAGTVAAFLRITDSQSQITEQVQEITILAELLQRSTTLELEKSAVDIEVYRSQLIATGKTDSNGIVTFTEELPRDSLVTYTVDADAVGLIAQQYQFNSTTDQTLQRSIQPVPITISSSLPGQYPRTTDTQDVASLVTANDPEQGDVPVTINLMYNGNNLDIANSSGTTWNFSTSDADPAGITENMTLEVDAPYSSESRTVSKEIFDRRDIEYLQTTFNTVEREAITIDLADVLRSEAEITSASVTNPSAGLEVSGDGFVYTVRPTENISTPKTYTFSIEAENADGTTTSQQASIDASALAEFSATVHDNVTDDIVSNAYLVLEKLENGVFVPEDTLFAVNGNFNNVELATEYARFGQQKAGKNFAYEHRIKPSAGGSYEVVVAPFTKRDENGNAIGVWSRDEMERRHNDMQRSFANSGYGTVNQQGQIGAFTDELAVFNTPNGQPKKVILAVNLETQYYDSNNNLIIEQDSMSSRDVALIQDWYQNETRQINAVGNSKITQPPALTVEQNYVLKLFDREDGNAYIRPRSEDDDRAAIGINSNGNGKIYDAFISLQSGSNQDPSQSGQYYSFTQESVALFGEHGTLPAQELGPLESMVNNSTNQKRCTMVSA
tara:strand:+ start:8319 stop:10760 length:2442 start_codon:yes stop_codon:yes gene_type:complete